MDLSKHLWVCEGCKLQRYPEEEIVKDGNKLYLLRMCRVCKYHDIELWNPKEDKKANDVNPPKRAGRFKFKFPGDYFESE